MKYERFAFTVTNNRSEPVVNRPWFYDLGYHPGWLPWLFCHENEIDADILLMGRRSLLFFILDLAPGETKVYDVTRRAAP